MAKFIIELIDLAKEQLQKHKKSGNKDNLNKISKIFDDLENHPFVGVGNPEQLKHSLSGFWSRKINQKDRIVYSVNDLLVSVEVISAMGIILTNK
jgi:toxin YoeB